MASYRGRHEDHAWTASELKPIWRSLLDDNNRNATRPGVPRSPGLVYQNDSLGKSPGMNAHIMVKQRGHIDLAQEAG
jgi:hypothetical protein